MPDSLRETEIWETFECLSARVKEAIKAGTFDFHSDRYLAWSLLRLDQQGWQKVATSIQALLALILEEQENAKTRLKKFGEESITMTIALGALVSPTASTKEP